MDQDTTLVVWLAGVLGLVLLNIAAYLAFAVDKAQARAGHRRIPEKTLLALAFLGGSFGAKTAQRRFRHKTRKQPFATILNAICVLHGLITIAAVLLIFRQM